MKIRILCLTFVLSTSIFAGNGTSGFEFLKIDFNARSSAMAGAFLGMRGDVSGILHNPAGMSYADTRQFNFNYVNYLLDIGGGQVAYTQRISGHGQISGLISYFNYGEFDETTEFANKTGNTFNAHDIAFAVSYSDVLEEMFSYGATLKYIHSKIDMYSASAFALDLGLIYEAPFQKDLYFGLALLNLGQPISAFLSTKESLPLSLRLGLTKKLEHLPLELNIALNDLNVKEEDFWARLKKFSLGGEFTISQLIRLRLGYNNDVHQGLDTGTGAGFSGVSVGLGLHISSYRFDYGFSSFGDLGATHRIGLTGDI
jgi:hypothetical protein